MRNLLFILGIIAFAILPGSCNFKKNESAFSEIPLDATWIRPHYSNLFLLATSHRDTFLILKDPSDTTKVLQSFCWGAGTQDFKWIKKIKSRNKIIFTTAVFAGMLESIQEEWRIIGLDKTDYETSPRTCLRIKEGKVSSVAKSGELNLEMVVRLQPDLLIGYYIEPKGKQNLLRAQTENCPVIFLQNFLENHPLGRAEWIKVFGYLTGKAQMANNQFDEIEEHYLSAAARVEEVKTMPSVLINAPFSGIWDIPAGQSYMATLIADAGGNYLWAAKNGTGRIPMDIEKVYTIGKDADIWINPGACRNLSCLQMLDSRLEKFTAFKKHQIYNSTKTLNAKGANAYWEYGVIRPDLVLLDLIKIMHPNKAEEHTSVFFEPLKSN